MPTTPEILAGLSHIANTWIAVSVGWHIAIAGLLVALLLGWRPPRSLFGTLLTLPSISVSILAWIANNPFNGTAFAVAAATLLFISAVPPRAHISRSPFGFTILGVTMILYGWTYPHFLRDAAAVNYFYAAPIGLIPCPTLGVIVGFTLLFNGLGSRGFATVLGAFALFYGLFGALRLGVHLDTGLVIGAVALLAQAVTQPAHRRRRHDRRARI